MAHYKQALTLHGFGATSLILGFLGAIFYWWVPTGLVLSIIGLVTGFIGLTAPRRSRAVSHLLVAGLVVSVLALILDSVIAGLGVEAVRFHALR